MNGLAYVMVVLGILLAKGIGFLRDIVFASVFGASVYTDMYFQIFGLVNLIFTGVGVALSTLVIKNLNKSEITFYRKNNSLCYSRNAAHVHFLRADCKNSPAGAWGG